jgi:hypothetical protein
LNFLSVLLPIHTQQASSPGSFRVNFQNLSNWVNLVPFVLKLAICTIVMVHYHMHPEYSPQEDDEDLQHAALPNEMKDHMWKAFAHKAGVGPHPGVYKGPAIKQPEGFETPEDAENQTEIHSDQAIANVSDFGDSPNVLVPPKVKKLPSMAPPSAADL